VEYSNEFGSSNKKGIFLFLKNTILFHLIRWVFDKVSVIKRKLCFGNKFYHKGAFYVEGYKSWLLIYDNMVVWVFFFI